MVDEVHQGFPSVAYGRRYARVLDASLRRHGAGALAAALAIFGLLVLILYSRVFSVLPGYPAVLLAFLVWAVAPGWLLQRALFGTRATTPAERLVMAFLMSMALAAAPGLLALRLHWSLEAFATLYALVAAAVSGLSILWHRDETGAPTAEETKDGIAVWVLVAVLAVPLLAILTSPAWDDNEIARDADDLVYAAYVNEYVTENALDSSQLFYGAREGAFGRMSVNVWAVTQALVADQADVQAMDLLQRYLPPLMTALAVAAAFALARGLFRSTSVGLLAGIFVLAYGALDLSPHEGFGRNVFLRIAEDKMVASFVLLPLGLLLTADFLSRPALRTYLAVQFAIVALAVVHPMAVVFFGVAFTSIVAFRALVERSASPLHRGALLGLPWAVPALAFLTATGFGESGVALGMGLQFRREFHLTDLPGGLLMGSYHMFLHPLVLAAVLSTPLLWLSRRRESGTQVALALVLGVLTVFFVPLLATPLAEVVSEQGVWRLPWVLPVPAILAYGCHEAASRFMAGRGAALAPLAAAGLVLGGALVVQEQYFRADGGAFYNRTSSPAIFPWTEKSIVVGGVDRAFSGDWRPPPAIGEVIDDLRESVPPGSTVLAPASIGRFFPGTLDDVQPVDYYGAPDILARQGLVAGFYDGSYPRAELAQALQRFGVTHVVTGRGSVAEELVQAAGGAVVEPVEPSLALSVTGFSARQGAPELGVHAHEGDEYLGWALDANELEELRGPTVSVPAGTPSAPGSLAFLLEVAPASDVVDADAVVRLIVTLDKLEEGQPVPGTAVHTVFELFLEEGSKGGARVLRLRSSSAVFAAGEAYRVRVWRDGESTTDTYPHDVWFAGLKIVHFPDTVSARPEEYRVYSYGGEAGPALTSVTFVDYETVEGLSPAGRDVLEVIRDTVPSGSTVLAPASVSRFFYEALDGVRPVDDLPAPDFEQRQKMVSDFYAGWLRGQELEAALERYGVTHVVTSAGSPPEAFFWPLSGGETPQPLAAFTPDSFSERQGTPDLAQLDGEYLAWALDADQLEEVKIPAVTIPESPSSEPWKLDLRVDLAPAEDVMGTEDAVRIVVTLDRLEDGKVVGAPIHTVFDLPLDQGAERGVRIERVRSAATTVSAGETYRVRVWRDGGRQIDTYPADLWFAGLTIAPSAYTVYEVR